MSRITSGLEFCDIVCISPWGPDFTWGAAAANVDMLEIMNLYLYCYYIVVKVDISICVLCV